MEHIEVTVRDKTVAAAVQRGLEELGLSTAEEANVEVVDEGTRGFLGMGGRLAEVKMSPKPKPKRRRRRRRGGKGRSEDGENGGGSQNRGGAKREQKPAEKPAERSSGRGGQQRQQRQRPAKSDAPRDPKPQDDRPEDDVDAQAEMVGGFLVGLIEALGLEGDVTTTVDDGMIRADITGEQTEVLIGPKGSLMRSVQELSRTVLQRKTPRPRRVLVDVAGYAARRREALGIYARRLAAGVLEEGGEIMLEPMNAADRKVVHDTVSDIDGVASYSEGEDPRRSVVLAATGPAAGDEEE